MLAILLSGDYSKPGALCETPRAHVTGQETTEPRPAVPPLGLTTRLPGQQQGWMDQAVALLREAADQLGT